MYKEVLYRYFNGTATRDEEEQVRQYIEASENNWKSYLDERKLFDAILLNTPAPGSMPATMPKRFSLRTFVRESAKMAAMLLLAFGLSFWLLNGFGTGSEESAPTVIRTQYGQMANVTLPDGSKVWLNSNTRLSYTAAFNTDKREIDMDGEAYFEVAHNADKPFIVHAPNHERVRVWGTKFNIEAYSGTGCFETSLMEGSVEICAGEKSLFIAPHQKAVWTGKELKVEQITDFDAYRWREGLICFRNTALSEILKEFEKYYDVKIDLQNRNMANPQLTVKFRLSDGVEYALRVLQKYAAFSFTRDDEHNRFAIR